MIDNAKNLAQIALVVTLAGGGVGCQGSESGSTESSQPPTALEVGSLGDDTECPHAPAIRLPGREDTITEIPLAGDRSPISGYHDCQRLLVDGGTRYGPEVALYAADGLHPDGAVLQVFARDGAYAPLGIEPGFNCLYPAGVGDAWMVPVGTDEAACLKPRTAHASKGTRLEVRIASGESESGADAPEAVRWDWDASRVEHYLGFNCDGRWCEAGRPGFASSEVPSEVMATVFEQVPGTPGATDAEARRVTHVKGWFDQQRLAEPDGRGGLVPGTVTGTVFPHPVLDRLDDRRTFEAGWVPVSYVYLDGESPTYKRKLNLDAGVNRMYLRFGDPAAFIPPGRSQGTCGTAVGWWIKAVSAKGDVTYQCASREAHPGVDVPGTTRWLWDPDDEKTWFACDQGCCYRQ